MHRNCLEKSIAHHISSGCNAMLFNITPVKKACHQHKFNGSLEIISFRGLLSCFSDQRSQNTRPNLWLWGCQKQDTLHGNCLEKTSLIYPMGCPLNLVLFQSHFKWMPCYAFYHYTREKGIPPTWIQWPHGNCFLWVPAKLFFWPKMQKYPPQPMFFKPSEARYIA